MSTRASPPEDLFYEALISSYVDDPLATERRWLAQAVTAAIEPQHVRFCLLLGEPGSGKTAVAAALTREHPSWLRYFIRRDSSSPLSAGYARSLLFALGHQLAATRPSLFEPRAFEMAIEQDVDAIAGDGKVTGIRVEDLLASPFYRTAMRVKQRVSFVAGELEGISIRRMVAEPRYLQLDSLLDLALLAPARVLLREDPAAIIIALIDALDELRYRDRQDNIIDWLAACPELPANIRFVLTARPDELLRSFCLRQQRWLATISISDQPNLVKADLHKYVSGFLSGRHGELIADLGPLEDFEDRIVRKAEGNFQYVATFFRGLEIALETNDRDRARKMLRLEDVPTSLGQLYVFFLTLIRASVGDRPFELGDATGKEVVRARAWDVVHRPILAMLCVAGDALSIQQLRKLVGLRVGPDVVAEAVGELRQFLKQTASGFRFYHATIPQFLTSEDALTSYPLIYVDPTEWHMRVAKYYLGAVSSWSDVAWDAVDDYGLRNIGRHVFETRQPGILSGEVSAATATLGVCPDSSRTDRQTATNGLLCLLCPALREAQAHRFGSDAAFIEDLGLLVLEAFRCVPPDASLIAYAAAVAGSTRAIVSVNSKHLFAAIALTDGLIDCLSRVSLVPDRKVRIKLCLEIGRELEAAGRIDETAQVFEQARKEARELPPGPKKWETMRAVARCFSRIGRFAEAADTARDIGYEDQIWDFWNDRMESAGYHEAAALAETAYAMHLRVGRQEDAIAVFREAIEVAEQLPDVENRSRTLALLADAAAPLGQSKALLEAASRIEEWFRDQTVRVVRQRCSASENPQAESDTPVERLKHLLEDEIYVTARLELEESPGIDRQAMIDFVNDANVVGVRSELAAIRHNRTKFLKSASFIARCLARAGRLADARQIRDDVLRASRASAAEISMSKLSSVMASLGRWAEVLQLDASTTFFRSSLELICGVGKRARQAQALIDAFASGLHVGKEAREQGYFRSIFDKLADGSRKKGLDDDVKIELARALARAGNRRFAAKLIKGQPKPDVDDVFKSDVGDVSELAISAAPILGATEALLLARRAAELRKRVMYADSEEKFSMNCSVAAAFAAAGRPKKALKYAEKALRATERVYYEDSAPGLIIGSVISDAVLAFVLADKYQLARKAIEAVEYNPWALKAVGTVVVRLLYLEQPERARRLARMSRSFTRLPWYTNREETIAVKSGLLHLVARILHESGEERTASRAALSILRAELNLESRGKSLVQSWLELCPIAAAAPASLDPALRCELTTRWLKQLSDGLREDFKHTCNVIKDGTGLLAATGSEEVLRMGTMLAEFNRIWLSPQAHWTHSPNPPSLAEPTRLH